MSQDKNIAFQAGLWYVVSSVMVKAVSLLTTPILPASYPRPIMALPPPLVPGTPCSLPSAP